MCSASILHMPNFAPKDGQGCAEHYNAMLPAMVAAFAKRGALPRPRRLGANDPVRRAALFGITVTIITSISRAEPPGASGTVGCCARRDAASRARDLGVGAIAQSLR